MRGISGPHESNVPEEVNRPSGSGPSTRAPEASPAESRKRLHQAYEDASLPSSQEEPAAKRARLDEPSYRNSGRPARKTDDEPKNYDDGTKKSGWALRPEANHIYPKQDNLGWPYKRPGMGETVTERMKQNPADQGSYSKTMQVDKFKDEKGDLRGENWGLKALGIQRNHTIADSSNARLLTDAYNNRHMQPGDAAHQAVNHYISTMVGHGTPEAQKAINSFEQALQTRDSPAGRGNLNNAIKQTSTGQNNMRFGPGAVNLDIGKGADYEHNSKGEISARSEELRDAVMNMARHHAVPDESARRAVTPTIKYTGAGQPPTGQYGPGQPRHGQYASSSSEKEGYDVGAKWGDMQDPETLRPRDRNHFDLPPANPYGVGQAAEDPTGNLPSDRKRKSEFLDE